MTKSVLHVVASADRRGAEVFATDLDRALRDRAWGSSVVALAPALEKPGIDVEVLASGHWLTAMPSLRRRAKKADVVVAHGSVTMPACVIAGLGLHIPLVYRSIGDPRFWSSDGIRRRRTDLLLQRMEAIVCLWGDAKSALADRGIDRPTLSVIPNAVDLDRFRPRTEESRSVARRRLGLPPEVPVVAYLGAYSWEKAPDVAVEAVISLPGVHLQMCGSGPMSTDLRRLARRASDRVVVGPPTDDPASLLHAADAVVIPSRTEGIPGVLLEAAACSVPVVASAVGGVPEAIASGIDGVVVDSADVSAVATALRTLLDRAPLGPSSFDVVGRYTLQSVADEWSELLGEIVSRDFAA